MRGFTFLAIVAFFSFAVFQQPGPLAQVSEATPIVISKVIEIEEEIEDVEDDSPIIKYDDVVLYDEFLQDEFIEEYYDEEVVIEGDDEEAVLEEIEDAEEDIETEEDIQDESLEEDVIDDEKYVEEELDDAVLVLSEDGDDLLEKELLPKEETLDISLVEQILETAE